MWHIWGDRRTSLRATNLGTRSWWFSCVIVLAVLLSAPLFSLRIKPLISNRLSVRWQNGTMLAWLLGQQQTASPQEREQVSCTGSKPRNTVGYIYQPSRSKSADLGPAFTSRLLIGASVSTQELTAEPHSYLMEPGEKGTGGLILGPTS